MVDQQDIELRHMMTVLICGLVDQPGDVEIHTSTLGSTVTFHVHVNAADTGKLIGVNGRTARALRIILGANAARLKRNLVLDIEAARPPSDTRQT